jgi:hypothetical protein
MWPVLAIASTGLGENYSVLSITIFHRLRKMLTGFTIKFRNLQNFRDSGGLCIQTYSFEI